MICVYLVLILSTCHTRVVLQGIIHVCNFFFNDNVYKMILHVFSSWVCDLLDIMKINLSNNKLIRFFQFMHILISYTTTRIIDGRMDRVFPLQRRGVGVVKLYWNEKIFRQTLLNSTHSLKSTRDKKLQRSMDKTVKQFLSV